MYYVYVLQNDKNKTIYIGYTKDLKQRIKEHRRGNTVTTKRLKTYTLVFYEAFRSKLDAKRREYYFKSTKGNSSLKQIIRESI